MSLSNKKILVCLTGGIACYKIPSLIRLLKKAQAEVRVVMTTAATKFITPLTVETVSGNPVAVELFPEGEYVATRHIDLAEWSDLVLVAPATANFLGKAAHGIADDLLTTIVSATPAPLMIAPAMNPNMWANPITKRNVSLLQEVGHFFVMPEEGTMACDDVGVGRMAEPEQIFSAVSCFLAFDTVERKLSGKRLVVTAGPTREPLDPVRFLSNYSSGLMGYALAQAAVLLGAETVLISGPSHLLPPAGVTFVSVESTADLYTATRREFEKSDALIMAAAPVDFTPTSQKSSKIKKTDKGLQLSLKPTVDILSELKKMKKPSQRVVGFALETERPIANAQKKLKEKSLDMIVVNQPGRKTGFNASTNQVTIIRAGKKPEKLPLMEKYEIAMRVLEKVAAML